MISYKSNLMLLILAILTLVFSGFSHTSDLSVISETEVVVHYTYDIESNIQPCFEEVESLSMSISRDCTVKIKTEDIDIELTLHDVGRWECFKLKVRALWARISGDL